MIMPDYNGNEIIDITHTGKKYCKYCGCEIPINAAFCSSCGKPQNLIQQQNEIPASHNTTTVIVNGNKSNGMGIAGFVISLLALLGCWIPVVNIVIWFLGALFSFIGLFKAPRGMAIAGFIISFIDIIIVIVIFGALVGLIGAAASN